MTTLILIRHAKSEWGSAALADHDRPLNDRGLRDAPVLAQRLAAALEASGTRVDAIVSSTALRARTTAAFFGAALGVEPELDEDLYGAPAATLLRAAASRGVAARGVAARGVAARGIATHGAAQGGEAVVVVAHDPGMTVLAERLSGGGIGHMPTCAVATFRWDTDEWDVATATDPDAWSFDSPR